VDLGNYDNVQYHLEIEIGKDCNEKGKFRQKFEVVADTGSSDLWIPSALCKNCKPDTAKYDMSKSCSAKEIGDEVTFRYGDGTTAAGKSFMDQVSLGGLRVEEQYMIQVDDLMHVARMKSDGILGLAHHYEMDGSRDGRTFLHTLFKEHPNLPNQFSFYLTGDSDTPNDTHLNSKLVLGDPDLAEHSKETEFRYGKVYANTHTTSLWLTSVWSIGLSGTGVDFAFPDRGTTGAPALVDSGSSLIVLAPEIYDELIKELRWRFTNCVLQKKLQILSCDCPPGNDLSRIPALVINVIDKDDNQFSLCLSPDEYILQSMDSIAHQTASCVPALQRGDYSQPVPMIFGMTFMRSFYTTFDVKEHRIGFARSKRSPLPANAQCSAHEEPITRRALWLSSVVIAISSMIFSCYVVLLPGGCARSPAIASDMSYVRTHQPMLATGESEAQSPKPKAQLPTSSRVVVPSTTVIAGT
jgi:hypothetical protein